MKKEEFYKKYGHLLVEVVEGEDAEYGNHMLLHPEETWIANAYRDECGFQIASIYETNEGDVVEIDNDLGNHPYKIGYLVIKPE